MKAGDQVIVQTSSYATRKGVFVRMIRQPNWIKLANQRGMGFYRFCLVQFKPNKHPSRVMFARVKKVES